MIPLAEMDQRQHLADPARHQRYVKAMFEEIAPRYDAFTRLFSFGMDAGWKRTLLRHVASHAALGSGQAGSARALDLACGTGDLAVALAEAILGLRVEGIDLAEGMVARARPHPRVSYRVGDACRLDAADASVDVITIGYGLRNVPDHRPVLAGIARVLRPGGVLGIIDFTRPAVAPWRWFLLAYLWLAGMAVGWWWHRHGPVYGYIARSIARFATRRRLLADLAAAGFEPVVAEGRLGGGIALIVARRRSG